SRYSSIVHARFSSGIWILESTSPSRPSGVLSLLTMKLLLRRLRASRRRMNRAYWRRRAREDYILLREPRYLQDCVKICINYHEDRGAWGAATLNAASSPCR